MGCSHLAHNFTPLMREVYLMKGVADAAPAHWRSMHSWIGLAVMIVYTLQWLLGAVGHSPLISNQHVVYIKK